MKIYLAARYGRREEIEGYARELEELGHTIVSRWHRESNAALAGVSEIEMLANAKWIQHAQALAVQNADALRSASISIHFTEPPHVAFPHGGRHVEFGMSLMLPQQIRIVVGYRENLFHCTGDLIGQFHETWEQARDIIGEEERRPSPSPATIVQFEGRTHAQATRADQE